MNFQIYLAPYIEKINHFSEEFFKSKISETKKNAPLASQIWQEIQNFTNGGKKIRGGLVKIGFDSFSGKTADKKLLPVSTALELTHGAILIHDDIIDQSDFRHNQPTVHRQFQKYHLNNYQKGSASHYGESMAIVSGIIGYYSALSLIEKSSFTDSLKLKAISQLAEFMTTTGYGEGIDVDLSYHSEIRRQDVITIHTYKTAYYTFIGPLKIGAILAGAQNSDLKKFEDFGLPLGIAFQLQDDILGIFGNEEKLGKPVGDDIREGKNTLLLTRVLEKGNSSQIKRIKELWGKKEISIKEIEEVRDIINKSGSLAYSQKLANELAAKSQKTIFNITKDKNLQEVFLTLSAFVVKREK